MREAHVIAILNAQLPLLSRQLDRINNTIKDLDITTTVQGGNSYGGAINMNHGGQNGQQGDLGQGVNVLVRLEDIKGRLRRIE